MAEPITSEDFEIWADHPVTRWVLEACAKVAAKQEATWKAAAWGGNLDPVIHARCKGRADAYDGLASVAFDQIQAMHNPNEEAEQ